MIREIKEWGSQNIKPKSGNYPEKPEDAKSLTRWLEVGKVPLDHTKVTYYAMTNGRQGYGYYRPNEVRDMTPDEMAEYEDMEANKFGKSTSGSQYAELASKYAALPKSQGNPPGKNWVYQNMEQYTGKRVVTLDTETTGFYNSDELLQLSIVGPKGDTRFNSYLKPHKRKTWAQAMAVNHITPEMVSNAPYPEDVREQVQKILDEADFIIGFNVNFDVRKLRNCMGLNIPDEKVVDVMKIFKKDEPNLPHYKLENAVELYATEQIKQRYYSGAHDSLTDTVATMHIFVQQYRLHIAGERAADQQRAIS